MMYDPDGLERLRLAVCIQAVKDYKAILKKLKKHPDDINLQFKKEKIETDFRSQYFCIIAGIDDGDEFASLIRHNLNVKRKPECTRVLKKSYGKKG